MRIKPLVLKNGKISQLQEGDLLDGQDNFSYTRVELSEVIGIPFGQQMILVGPQIIEGELRLDGSLVMDEFINAEELETFPENFSHSQIATLDVKIVPSLQQMFLVSEGPMIIEGEFQVDGSVVVDQVKDTDIPEVIIPLLPDDNFSWKDVPSGLTKALPSNQQMIVDGLLLIEGGLLIEGELSLIDDNYDEPLTPYMIAGGELFRIKERRQLFSVVGLVVEGEIQNDGLMAMGA